jgi:hypothetical protein
MVTSLLVCIAVYGALALSVPARRLITRDTRVRSARLVDRAA